MLPVYSISYICQKLPTFIQNKWVSLHMELEIETNLKIIMHRTSKFDKSPYYSFVDDLKDTQSVSNMYEQNR